MKTLGLLAVFVALSGCTHAKPRAPEPVAAVSGSDTEETQATPRVEIRDFPYAPTLAIVAWSEDDAAAGLRAMLRRDGSLVRDHQFYISTSVLGNFNPFAIAATNRPPSGRYVQTLVPAGRALEVLGSARDEYFCDGGGKTCSPYESFRVRVPDSLLRANRDSITVRLYGVGSEFVISVNRAVIDPYLAAVDSVSAALRKK